MTVSVAQSNDNYKQQNSFFFFLFLFLVYWQAQMVELLIIQNQTGNLKDKSTTTCKGTPHGKSCYELERTTNNIT